LGLLEWNTPGQSRVSFCDRPHTLPTGAPFRVGHQDIHYSHNIRHYKGLVDCIQCDMRIAHARRGKCIRELARPRSGKNSAASLRLSDALLLIVLPVLGGLSPALVHQGQSCPHRHISSRLFLVSPATSEASSAKWRVVERSSVNPCACCGFSYPVSCRSCPSALSFLYAGRTKLFRNPSP
jgi:hypothetical protein